jgi:hypothetical protein
MGEKMIVEFEFPSDVWEIIPRDFPTVDGLTEEAWSARLVATYIDSVGDQDGLTTRIVSDLALRARNQIDPLDVATVLFRPPTLPITAIVHIQLFQREGIDAGHLIASGMVPEIPLALRPVLTPFSNDTFGEGMKAAFVAVEALPDGSAVGGLSYAFASESHVLNIQSSPARLDVVGILDQHLDGFVETVRLSEGVMSGVQQVR